MTDSDWLDRAAYPFSTRFFETGSGRMHYVDVGEGPAVLLVHGTPTWSFLYRRLIDDLRQDHRVIAPDLLGFGLSDKPVTDAVAPPRQAEHLRALVDHLGWTGSRSSSTTSAGRLASRSRWTARSR